jgi:hypothetical protein
MMGKTRLLTVLTVLLVLGASCGKDDLSPSSAAIVGKSWYMDSAVLDDQGTRRTEKVPSGSYVLLRFTDKTYTAESNMFGAETKNYERMGSTVFYWAQGGTKSNDKYFNLDFPASNRMVTNEHLGNGQRLYQYFTAK